MKPRDHTELSTLEKQLGRMHENRPQMFGDTRPVSPDTFCWTDSLQHKPYYINGFESNVKINCFTKYFWILLYLKKYQLLS